MENKKRLLLLSLIVVMLLSSTSVFAENLISQGISVANQENQNYDK